jgi:hypothetical protein
LKFVFHVGPHKTGTTAIQICLRDNRKSLLESKIFIPETSFTNHGHHEIPWALLGWDLRLIGAQSKEFDLELYLGKVIAGALLGECDTIVFSSEDFSLLDDNDWSNLLITIQKLAPMGTQADFKILFFYRNIDDLVRSNYKTLVLLGLDLKFEKVQEKLRGHFDNIYRLLEALPNRISTKMETLGFNYQSEGNTDLFWTYFSPDLKISEKKNMSVRFNAQYSDKSIELFRKKNSLDSARFDIDSLLHWPSFHSLTSNSRVASRRREMFPDHDAHLIGSDVLLRQIDKLLSERDILLSERDKLRFELDLVYKSRSWGYTRPVRCVANYFRSLRHKQEVT